MAEVERWMHDGSLEIVDAVSTPGGRQGAQVLTLRHGATTFRAKWRSLESASVVSDPRKELGAYAVQRLFLEPKQYVIPPTAGHCFPLRQYRARVDATALPSFRGATCVFGFLSYWLPDAHDVDDAEDLGILHEDSLYDEALFQADPVYRRSLVNLNLVAFLVHQADSHDGQFVLTNDSGGTHTYSVDNSMSFQSITNPLVLFREDWSAVRVPVIPESTRAALRAIQARDLDALKTIEEYELQYGVLSYRPPKGAAPQTDAGLRWLGDRLEVGLTRGEIDGVQKRLGALNEKLAP